MVTKAAFLAKQRWVCPLRFPETFDVAPLEKVLDKQEKTAISKEEDARQLTWPKGKTEVGNLETKTPEQSFIKMGTGKRLV